MGLILANQENHTTLNEEEKEGLKIKSIATRQELNEFEQQNIETAISWLMKRNISIELFLSEKFLKNLHYKMFGSVWLWAGTFRKSNTNLGIDWRVVPVELKKLFDDCLYWLENKTFSGTEIAIRFKHRLVFIHPFPNGNGRLSRLMADTMMEKIFEKPAFSWGGLSVNSNNNEETRYIDAIHKADKGNFDDLIKFSMSGLKY
ncbi:MAG: mobile mystery protein B [Patescibacteria group bacterium]